MSTLLTVPEAAKRLNCSPSTLYLWSHLNGKTDTGRNVPDLKFSRIGGSLRIAESELQAFIERHTK